MSSRKSELTQYLYHYPNPLLASGLAVVAYVLSAESQSVALAQEPIGNHLPTEISFIGTTEDENSNTLDLFYDIFVSKAVDGVITVSKVDDDTHKYFTATDTGKYSDIPLPNISIDGNNDVVRILFTEGNQDPENEYLAAYGVKDENGDFIIAAYCILDEQSNYQWQDKGGNEVNVRPVTAEGELTVATTETNATQAAISTINEVLSKTSLRNKASVQEVSKTAFDDGHLRIVDLRSISLDKTSMLIDESLGFSEHTKVAELWLITNQNMDSLTSSGQFPDYPVNGSIYDQCKYIEDHLEDFANQDFIKNFPVTMYTEEAFTGDTNNNDIIDTITTTYEEAFGKGVNVLIFSSNIGSYGNPAIFTSTGVSIGTFRYQDQSILAMSYENLNGSSYYNGAPALCISDTIISVLSPNGIDNSLRSQLGDYILEHLYAAVS